MRMPLQGQETAAETIREKKWTKQLYNVICRVCKRDRETAAHIMLGCSALPQIEYLKRFNGKLRGIYC